MALPVFITHSQCSIDNSSASLNDLIFLISFPLCAVIHICSARPVRVCPSSFLLADIRDTEQLICFLILPGSMLLTLLVQWGATPLSTVHALRKGQASYLLFNSPRTGGGQSQNSLLFRSAVTPPIQRA